MHHDRITVFLSVALIFCLGVFFSPTAVVAERSRPSSFDSGRFLGGAEFSGDDRVDYGLAMNGVFTADWEIAIGITGGSAPQTAGVIFGNLGAGSNGFSVYLQDLGPGSIRLHAQVAHGGVFADAWFDFPVLVGVTASIVVSEKFSVSGFDTLFEVFIRIDGDTVSSDTGIVSTSSIVPSQLRLTAGALEVSDPIYAQFFSGRIDDLALIGIP